MSEYLERQKALDELVKFIQGLRRVNPARNVDLEDPEPDTHPQAGILASREEVIDCFLKAKPEYERFWDAFLKAYAQAR